MFQSWANGNALSLCLQVINKNKLSLCFECRANLHTFPYFSNFYITCRSKIVWENISKHIYMNKVFLIADGQLANDQFCKWQLFFKTRKYLLKQLIDFIMNTYFLSAFPLLNTLLTSRLIVGSLFCPSGPFPINSSLSSSSLVGA